MERLQFRTEINSDPKTVWKALWDEANYRTWTSVFSEGSTVKTDGWKQGTTVHFLDGKGAGMYSRVDEHVPERSMVFEHLGMVKDGQEMPLDEETKKWAGAKESYRVDRNGDRSELVVEVDVTDGHADYFQKTFPPALEKVKQIAENGK
jgi:uncharacterized protein YndB with AHSA1/START domain